MAAVRNKLFIRSFRAPVIPLEKDGNIVAENVVYVCVCAVARRGFIASRVYAARRRRRRRVYSRPS